MPRLRAAAAIAVMGSALWPSGGGASAGAARSAAQALGTWAPSFAPAPGLTLGYSLTARTAVDGKDILGRDLTLDISADGEVRLAVRRVTTESVLAGLSSPGIRVGLTGPGTDESHLLRAEESEAVLASFDRAGRLLEIRNVDALEEKNPLNFSIAEVLRICFPPLPSGPVSVGESWTDRKKIKVPYREMNLEINLESRLTLDRLLESREGRKALITAAFRVSLSGGRPLEGGVAAEFKGRGDGTGSLAILADDGTVADYRMSYSLDGAMAARRGTETLVEWPFRLSFAGSLVRLDGR